MPDRTKYMFNGYKSGKGRIVLQVVRRYIEQHPEAGFDDIRQVFPDELQKTSSVQFSADGMCVVKRLNDVTDKKRFHLNEEDQLQAKGEKIVVSREWNVINFKQFIIRARQLGFEISR